jgi:hypothetical protein
LDRATLESKADARRQPMSLEIFIVLGR